MYDLVAPSVIVASFKFLATVVQSHSQAVSWVVLQVLGNKERRAAIITGLNLKDIRKKHQQRLRKRIINLE